MLLLNRSRCLASFALAALALSGSSARADNFTFSFTNTIGTVAGTVTGEILGLAHSGTGPASQMLITSGPAGLNSIYPYPVDATSWSAQLANSFSTVNGVITVANFQAQNSVNGFPVGAQFYIFSAVQDFNFLNVDGTDTAYVWNDDGPSGISFAPLAATVPEPSSLMLLVTGVLGAVGAARRKLRV